MRITEISALPKYGHALVPKHVQPPNASDEDAAAMRWYTGHGYSPINAQLRGHKPDFERGSDDEMIQDYGVAMSNDEGITRIDRLINGAPLRQRAIKVFRGESNSEITHRYLAMNAGQSFTDSGYLSTTFDPSRAFYSFAQLRRERGNASNALSMYMVPKSIPGAYMHFDGEAAEQEFVIARNATYTLRDKRPIPVKNHGYPVKEITLLVWDVSYAKSITEAVQWSDRTIGDDQIIWVDAEKIRASWENEKDFYFDSAEHPNAIKGRVQRFDGWMNGRLPVDPPEVCLNPYGEITFTNGRHRFVWMLQHGVTNIPVAVPPEYAREIENRFGC